ncbi:hypothetical protein PNB57_12155, partial [Enterococcus faecium]|nr:hypothetical protein [Enterococcus faecium]
TGFSYKCRFHRTLLLCFSIAQNTIKKKNDPSANTINLLTPSKKEAVVKIQLLLCLMKVI